MKRILIFLLALSFFSKSTLKADEGMWLPMLLGEQVYSDMVKKGLKLTKEQLYSINQASIKDAIIIFGGGCTGEIVSKEGLIFTNHHCGYGAIAAASTVKYNYLRDGFWARNKQEEIPAKGIHAQFLVKIVDVTEKVNQKIKDFNSKEINQKLGDILEELSDKEVEGTAYEGRVVPMFKGNQFLLFVYERFTDVRLVGAPSESIGKFGGDTDNWEWPRHTGDFSIFRVYMGKDGKPADFSTENIPLKPKHFLPISIKGVKDGDYAMIYGYPGGTNRYETSFGVKLKTDIENPSIVSLRDTRLKLMFEEMKKDPATKLQLSSYYAGVANYWKFFDGETKQLLKFKTFEEKQANETAFLAWAKNKPEYANLFDDYQKAYEAWKPYTKQKIYLTEGILGSRIIAFAINLQKLDIELSKSEVKKENISKIIAGLKRQWAAFISSENIASDKNILSFVAQSFYNEVDAAQHPKGFYNWMNTKFGDLKDKKSYDSFSEYVFTNSMILDSIKWNKFLENPDTTILHKDAAFMVGNTFMKNYTENFQKPSTEFVDQNNTLGRLYLKGVLEMNKGKKMYPDANFTMRVSYGNVKSYVPRDGVKYSHVCTLSGVLEKYKPGDYEFDLPEKVVELAKKKDFGQYADPILKDIVVGYITTNDITGGNSGSPVINGNGELTGLCFDGNYESLSHKIAFDKDLNRTICVDVRYVLWVVDKVGGATNIIQELDLRK